MILTLALWADTLFANEKLFKRFYIGKCTPNNKFKNNEFTVVYNKT